jgi:hypothetical protein
MRVFHYTTLHCYRLIDADGVIKPATAHVPKNERPAVWFSTNPVWEPTTDKLILLSDGSWRRATTQELIEAHEGLVRIEVAPASAPYSWNEYKIRSGITAKVARGLYRVALAQRSRPGQWFVSFNPVPRDQWLEVELSQGAEWRPLAAIKKLAASPDFRGPILGSSVERELSAPGAAEAGPVQVNAAACV